MKQILVLKNGEETEKEVCEISNLEILEHTEKRRRPHKNVQKIPATIDAEYVVYECIISFTINNIINEILWQKYKPDTKNQSGRFSVKIFEGDESLLHKEFELKKNKKISGIFEPFSSQIPDQPEESENWIGKQVVLNLTYDTTIHY